MTSSHFITNEPDRNLASVINGIIPNKTESMDFLVGYFYFSGIEGFAEKVKDKHIRILVGKDLDPELVKTSSTAQLFPKNQLKTGTDIQESYQQTLIDLFNNSAYFENKQNEASFRIYMDKLKNGTLEIRRTKEPWHAKLYIFNYNSESSENGETPGCVITGSSNLTYNGLEGQGEINVRFNSTPEHEEATRIFNELWDDSIKLVNKETFETFKKKISEKIWLDNIPTPYLAFLRVLHEYFNLDTARKIRTPYETTNQRFQNLKYQADAIRMAINAIEKHNGVIIADVVGLGKSIIASSVADNLRLPTIIIAPPHLIPQWDDYITEFRLSTAKAFSSGKIEAALDHFKKFFKNEQCLIIIDEAHNYRNEFTQDYAMLHELCQENKVMLLTATPFNNAPSDIYSMVKLFQYPSKTTLQTVANLGKEFRELIREFKKIKDDQREKKLSDEEIKPQIVAISNEIRRIIEPLVIRRSRLDLKAIPAYAEDLKIQNIDFPEVQPPKLLEYDLGNLSGLYQDTLEQISPEDPNATHNYFKATRYNPLQYIKEGERRKKLINIIEKQGFDYDLFASGQRNLAQFMRTMLVRRFESSQRAFKISLDNMLFYCNSIKNWMEKRKRVPIFKKGQLPIIDNESTVDDEDCDSDLEDKIKKLQDKGLFEIPTDYLTADFLKNLNSDIKVLESLKKRWEKVSEDDDPKWNEFIKIIERQLKKEPNRKIVVFSQFADTVEYLYEKLHQKRLPVLEYTSHSSSPAKKEAIRNNFDAGVPEEHQKDDYKILIATDAISEGYNLHRAGAIFNYDIPYNPTRVIQRVGRINRINKKVFDKLFIYNYFPTEIGESETRIKAISTLKMAMIHALMGEDTKILTTDEQLKSFFKDQYERLTAQEEQQSWYVKYLALYNQMLNSDEMKEALQLPLRTKLHRKEAKQDGVLLFAKHGLNYVFKFSNNADDKPQILAPEDALALFEAAADEIAYPLSDRFDPIFDSLKKPENRTNRDVDTSKRNALDKIKIILEETKKKKDNKEKLEYLHNLQEVIKLDAISGYNLRFINQLKKDEYDTLYDKISDDYLVRILNGFNGLDFHGEESLIVAEELETQTAQDEPQNAVQLSLL